MLQRIRIGNRWIGPDDPPYFIAEVGANFDSSLDEAKRIVEVAKKVGADAVKFQSFTADTLVSDHSFATLKIGYQAGWTESVRDVYQSAEFPLAWHREVAEHSRKVGIQFFTSVWNRAALAQMEALGAPVHKIGSGDLTWTDFIAEVAKTGKPVFLSTGASELAEVAEAVAAVRSTGNDQLILLQCIVNYPSRHESANIRVLETYRKAFGTLVGYSDHSPGDVVPLGAIALGACVIEKHFTLDRRRVGPDHGHSLEPQEFHAMVERGRVLQRALGSSEKRVMEEEKDSKVIMRRSLHTQRAVAAGEPFTEGNVIALRPATGIAPALRPLVLGRKAVRSMAAGQAIRWEDVGG
ncbi:MAG: flagellar biosynthesis protein FlgA [SAR202 cluster bacterium]|nr:flagellar biosynthesis protein FlgA [SAR202 cluster bacterium]